MTRRNQFIVLGVLLVVLVLVLYVMFRPSGGSPKIRTVDQHVVPVNVDNPALRMDILNRFLKLEYKGVHRSIFSASLPPPPPSTVKSRQRNIGPIPPPPPPPLSVDAKYFGYVSDSGGNHRRAFFATNNNEDVIIAGEGDTLMGRFRVVRITNVTTDVEEVSSGRRATLTLEEPGPNG